MIQRFKITTFFDCTATGVQNHRRSKNLSDEEWHFQRNQQRNFETILQCVSLRCQPMNIQGSFVNSNNDGQLYWSLLFESDKQDIFLLDQDPCGILKQDCNHVPMIIGLTETERELFFTPYLITQGAAPNIFFQRL